MSVRIRLRRVGRKKQPSYRLVAATSTTPRAGEYLETLGFYNPRGRPAELRVNLERIDEWLGKGAEMSDTAASLIKRARKGSDTDFNVVIESGAGAPQAGGAGASQACAAGASQVSDAVASQASDADASQASGAGASQATAAADDAEAEEAGTAEA